MTARLMIEQLAIMGATRTIELHHELVERGLAGVDVHDLAMAVLVLQRVGLAARGDADRTLKIGRADLDALLAIPTA
jgi:hypothetical protein